MSVLMRSTSTKIILDYGRYQSTIDITEGDGVFIFPRLLFQIERIKSLRKMNRKLSHVATNTLCALKYH